MFYPRRRDIGDSTKIFCLGKAVTLCQPQTRSRARLKLEKSGKGDPKHEVLTCAGNLMHENGKKEKKKRGESLSMLDTGSKSRA